MVSSLGLWIVEGVFVTWNVAAVSRARGLPWSTESTEVCRSSRRAASVAGHTGVGEENDIVADTDTVGTWRGGDEVKEGDPGGVVHTGDGDEAVVVELLVNTVWMKRSWGMRTILSWHGPPT